MRVRMRATMRKQGQGRERHPTLNSSVNEDQDYRVEMTLRIWMTQGIRMLE